MAQFDLEKALAVLVGMIAQHQDVSDKMTPEEVAGYLAANYPWMQGMAKFYGLDADTVARAACCFSFQKGVEYNQSISAAVDAPIPDEFWKNPSDYKARGVAFCDALGALNPFVGKGDSLTVRPEYGG